MNLHKLKQYFDVLSNDKHRGEPVLMRVRRDNEIVWTDDFKATIHSIESDGQVVLNLVQGAMLRVERDTIKLKR